MRVVLFIVLSALLGACGGKVVPVTIIEVSVTSEPAAVDSGPTIFDACEPDFPYEGKPLALPINDDDVAGLSAIALLHYVGPDAFSEREDDILLRDVTTGTVTHEMVDDAADVTVASAWDPSRTLYRFAADGALAPFTDDVVVEGASHTFEYELAADAGGRSVVEVHTVGDTIERAVDSYSILRNEGCSLVY